MKNLTYPLRARLGAVLLSALAFGACNRAEYAALPTSPAYLGHARAATPAPTASPQKDEEAAKTSAAVVAAPVEMAPPAAATPAAKPTEESVKPTAVSGAEAAKPAPVASAATAEPQTLATPTAPRKLNFAQRLVVKKLTKKLDKLAHQAPLAKQHDATAARGGSISGNLRIGIILLLIGLLVGLLNGLIGTIIAIIGLVFIILWLLDQA